MGANGICFAVDRVISRRERGGMNSSNVNKIELLGRIAEMKRIYAVIESSISHTGCVVVTSGTQGEGKSTLAAGLAIAAANRSGSKVLLVDFHWYSPVLHQYFGVQCGESIDAYAHDGKLDGVVCETPIDHLYLLPAFKGNGGSNEKDTMNLPSLELLRKAKHDFGLVIVDTAPAFPTNYRMIDPIEVSKLSDGVVLVTLTNVTPRQHLKRACTAIETSGANILGIVANQWQNPIY